MRSLASILAATLAVGGAAAAHAQSAPTARQILDQTLKSSATTAAVIADPAPTCVDEADFEKPECGESVGRTRRMSLARAPQAASAPSPAPMRTASLSPQANRTSPARRPAPVRRAMRTDAAAAANCAPDEASGDGSANLCATFALNSAELTAKTRALLDEMALLLRSDRQWTSSKFIIQGHADARGNPQRNRELSVARANTIRDYLVAKGVSADRLTVQGFGAERPIAGRSPTDPMNRRVQVARRS